MTVILLDPGGPGTDIDRMGAGMDTAPALPFPSRSVDGTLRALFACASGHDPNPVTHRTRPGRALRARRCRFGAGLPDELVAIAGSLRHAALGGLDRDRC